MAKPINYRWWPVREELKEKIQGFWNFLIISNFEIRFFYWKCIWNFQLESFKEINFNDKYGGKHLPKKHPWSYDLSKRERSRKMDGAWQRSDLQHRNANRSINLPIKARWGFFLLKLKLAFIIGITGRERFLPDRLVSGHFGRPKSKDDKIDFKTV